jgi:adenylate cyclase
MREEPERLAGLLNRVLTLLSDIVLRHGGTIDKYIGDCLMAFWNAPLDDPDHALHAAQAAREMHLAIAEMNRAASAPPIAIGIGINTGECIVGNMGSERRFDYTAVGDAVNIAARLQELCKTFNVGIVLGEATASELEGRMATQPLGQVPLAGRQGALAVYALQISPPHPAVYKPE